MLSYGIGGVPHIDNLAAVDWYMGLPPRRSEELRRQALKRLRDDADFLDSMDIEVPA